MAMKKQLENKMQVARQEVEQLRAEVQNEAPTEVYLEKIKANILGEVSTLGDTMKNLYEELVTVHKEVVHLHCLQQKCKYQIKTLNIVQTSISIMHEW